METTATDVSVGRPAEGGRALGLRLRVLGPFEAVLADGVLDLGGPKQRAVLALLALHAPTGLTLGGVIDGLWGEHAPDSARASVYAYVSNLRALLGGGIERRRGSYVLAMPFRADSAEVEAALDRARASIAWDPDGAAADLRDALAAWRGLPYADLVDVPGLADEVRRLEELRVLAVEARVDADLAAGRSEELVPELRALVDQHPLRERFRAQLMLALYRSGRQAEALREYGRVRELLAEELGVDPSPELQELELRILRQEGGLASGRGQVTTERLAFLFTDIEGSTRLWNEHRGRMAAALARHDRIITETVEETGGTVFKHTGDGAIAVFATASAAAEAAERAQRALQRAEWAGVDDLRVRMAIDVGDVDIRDGDYFGPPLNRCARILGTAHGGQVVLSSSAFDDLSSGHHPGVQIKQLGTHRLRGLGAAERLAQLVFVGLPADFPDLVTDAPAADLDERLEVGGLPGYELRERLGRGAWGSVYRAYQPAMGREVAIRVISSHLSNHPSFVRRFEAHARAVADLEHPFIVPLHDFWRDYEGAYLVMQLMRGGSLARELRDEPWEPAAALTLLRQVGSALAHAHGEGAVHGDLRPENVLLDGRGNAYLTDFGLTADFISADLRRPSSSPYAAPEIRAGGPPDERSDLYSLAVLAHALLSGREPISSQPLPPLGPAVARVDTALLRGSASDPDDRFDDVAQFIEALEAAVGVGSTADGPPIRTGARNPYKGLRSFSERDAADFHGRSGLVDALVDAVGHRRLVAVVGPSGSGKSSAVQAGLVPRLRAGGIADSESWFVASMTPGTHPVAGLASALQPLAMIRLGDIEGRLSEGAEWPEDLIDDLLPPEPAELVLVVDQFEELYTIAAHDEVEPFLDLLVGAVDEDSRVKVIVTLRADFYDRPLEHPVLGALVSDGTVTVIPPTVDELVEAIERPAHAVGLSFEPGLPMRIAGDVIGQPGGLPLVQYALTEMVERRRSDVLGGFDYESIGTVHGAVARRAEEVFGGLDEAERTAAKTVLLRLVTVDEDTDDTRRRVRLAELEGLGHPPAAVARVLDVFGESRLLSFDRDPTSRTPTVEVAHEALLREWGRLGAWIDEEREGLILARRMRLALSEWEQSGRSEAFLLTGDRLAPFRGWSRSDRLNREEVHFLEQSEEADRSARLARRRRRQATLLVLASAAVVAVVLAIFAFAEGRRADEEAARAVHLAGQEADARLEAEEQRRLAEASASDARRAEDLAKARELASAAIGVGGEDPQLSMLLALEAFDVAPADAPIPIELPVSLREAIYGNRLVGIVDTGAVEPGGMKVSPSGRWVAVDSWGTEELILLDMDSESVTSRVNGRQFSLLAFSPDESQLLLRSDEALELRSLDTGEVLETIDVECAPHWAPDGAWSADGGLVAYASEACAAVLLLETDGWTEVHRIPIDPEQLMGVEMAGGVGANRLLVREWISDRPAAVVDTTTFDELTVIDDSLGAISPDGSLVLGVDYGDGPRLYDATNGEVVDRLDGMWAEPRTSAPSAFSPGGRWVFVPTEGAMLPIWEVATGELAFRLPAGQTAVAAFGTDDRLFSMDDEGAISVWDLSGSAAGEAKSVETGLVHSMRGVWASDSVGAVVGGRYDTEQREVSAFDPAGGDLLGSRSFDQGSWPWVGVLGGRVVVIEVGPTGSESLLAWDPGTGSVEALVDCAGSLESCVEGTLDHTGAWSSTDGSMFGLLTGDRVFRSWEADGDERPAVPLDYQEDRPQGLFMLMSFSDEWIVARLDWNVYGVFDHRGALVEEVEVLDHPWLRFDRTGARGIGWGFGTGVSLIDTSDWSVDLLTDDLGEGLVRDASFSPSAELAAIGVQGGPMRVFSVPEGELVARIPIDSVVGSYWIDEDHIAVASRDGLWTVVTLDLDELRSIAESQLHREFTEDECRSYRIESCRP